MRMGTNKESVKENDKPAASFKTFMSVFRPIREWLNTRPKTPSPPLSSASAVSAPLQQPHRPPSQPRPHISRPLDDSLVVENCQEVMASPEANPFCRSAQARMSLPIMQHNKMRHLQQQQQQQQQQAYAQRQRQNSLHHQQQAGTNMAARSMGHIYLQHKGETKQASLPNELTTIDTIRALFVCAFPHMLTMEYMSQPHVKVYIYNPSCNIFYELCDIDDVRHESVLRIHQSDPLLPLALTPQISLASMGGGGGLSNGHHNPYSALHRLPPRMPPLQLQAHSGSQSSLCQPPSMPSHMMPSMTQTPVHHHQMLGLPNGHHHTQTPPLSQIPPPKPRRMIPASYSMHRLSPNQ